MGKRKTAATRAKRKAATFTKSARRGNAMDNKNKPEVGLTGMHEEQPSAIPAIPTTPELDATGENEGAIEGENSAGDDTVLLEGDTQEPIEGSEAD